MRKIYPFATLLSLSETMKEIEKLPPLVRLQKVFKSVQYTKLVWREIKDHFGLKYKNQAIALDVDM